MRSINHCSVENCKDKYLSNGYCYLHYWRWYHSGDPSLKIRTISSEKEKGYVKDNIGYLPLPNSSWAIIDAKDYEMCIEYLWHTDKKGYVRNSKFSLHRFLMDPIKGMIVDHINHNVLDNRRCNLRICTQKENCQNMLPKQLNPSGYKGVSIDNDSGKWLVQICTPNGRKKIGRYCNVKEAAQAYNEAALYYFGEFACINKIN